MPAVLIVESDEDLRDILVEGFRMEGWTSVAAAGMPEAISKASGVRVDVVLTDVILSRGDGVALELAFRRRNELRHVPFVFMTAFAPYLDQLGPGRALLKPFRLEQACVLLQSALSADPGRLKRGALACDARLPPPTDAPGSPDRGAAAPADLRTRPS